MSLDTSVPCQYASAVLLKAALSRTDSERTLLRCRTDEQRESDYSLIGDRASEVSSHFTSAETQSPMCRTHTHAHLARGVAISRVLHSSCP